MLSFEVCNPSSTDTSYLSEYDAINFAISSVIQSGLVAIEIPTILLLTFKAESYFSFRFSSVSYVFVKF